MDVWFSVIVASRPETTRFSYFRIYCEKYSHTHKHTLKVDDEVQRIIKICEICDVCEIFCVSDIFDPILIGQSSKKEHQENRPGDGARLRPWRIELEG